MPGSEPQTTGSQPRTTELGASKTGRKKLRSGRTRKDPNDRRAPKMRAQGSRLPEPCALAKTVRPGKRQVRVQ
ncbi:hypothetical protein HMPREF0972_01784 [Actinomyces sp. oral taxon 848 str. F0332]|nr:hypothetical protein HMPREF0972_01784 [Actinomyces sp. oral taxon 848 str. F0332]